MYMNPYADLSDPCDSKIVSKEHKAYRSEKANILAEGLLPGSREDVQG